MQQSKLPQLSETHLVQGVDAVKFNTQQRGVPDKLGPVFRNTAHRETHFYIADSETGTQLLGC